MRFGVDLAEIQNVVDQCRQMARVAVDRVQVIPEAGR
jgi:hypothetical protein